MVGYVGRYVVVGRWVSRLGIGRAGRWVGWGCVYRKVLVYM